MSQLIPYARCSFPPSKLNKIEERLRPSSEKLESSQLVDHVRNDEDVFWNLEDLQEAIFDYRVRSRSQV